MSIRIPIDADTSQVEAKLKGLGIQTQQVNQNVQKTQTNLLQLYTYSAHITTLITSMIRRNQKGTEESLAAQGVAQFIQVASTEISIGTTIAQAFAAAAAHNYVQAGLLMSAAGLMQGNLASQQILLQQTKQAQKETRALRDQMDRW
jgi:hypothetical protein